MVGTSSGTAPYSRSRSDTADACSLVRGTSTRQPNSGLVSYQDILLFAAAASPTTATALPRVVATVTPAAFRSGPIRPSVVATVCWSVVVPSQVIANGVASGQPAAISILPSSCGAVSAPSTASVPGPWDTWLASPAWITRSSPGASPVSAMPA